MPIRFASEAWPRPGLAEPRSASIAGFGNTEPLSSREQKGKDGHDQDKGLVLGSFLVPEIDMIFGDGVGGLPCSRPLLPTRCWFDAFLHWNSAAEEGDGLKTGPPRRYRIQSVEGPVLDLCAKETCLKRGQKVDPLEIKSGPPWRVQFWPLHCG